MNKEIKPRGYWTYEKCRCEAAKYTTKKDFLKNSSSSYVISIRNGWMKDICSHMDVCGNKNLRFVYVFEFEDNSAYIGLTYNIEKRELKHLSEKEGVIYNHIKKTNSKYVLINLIKTPIISIDAQELEHKTKLKYLENGWNILNSRSTGRGIGSLGGNTIKWTYEALKGEALKYKTKSEFKLKSHGAYSTIVNKKLINELCSHLIQKVKPNRYWTKEKCQEEALKYKKRNIFFEKSPSAYSISSLNRWLKEICSHMIEIRKPKGYWSFEKCKEEALKYETKKDFKKKSHSAYIISVEKKYLNNICSHMNKKLS